MESPTPTTTTTASAPGDFQKYTHTTADNTPTPPFLRLPPELVLRIFGFVALQGLPTDLARLCLTTRRFYIYLSDPGRSFDQSIWRSSATVLMGECVPNTLTLENTWRAFVQRVWRLTKPVQVGTDVQALEQGEVLVTSAGGPFPEVERVTEVEDGVETVTQDKQTAEDEPKRTQELLTPVPAGARRVVDFVHSGTEGSRGDLWGMSYVGANSGAFFTFADDPRDWVHTPKQIEKGYISGDGSLVDGKGIVTAGVQSLHHLLGDTVGLEESTQLTSFKAWLRSNVLWFRELGVGMGG